MSDATMTKGDSTDGCAHAPMGEVCRGCTRGTDAEQRAARDAYAAELAYSKVIKAEREAYWAARGGQFAGAK